MSEQAPVLYEVRDGITFAMRGCDLTIAASAQLRYLENEQDYVNYIWPQVVSEDRKEAIAAFREKRTPNFKGK